jgi:hypothetical protein
LILVKFCKERWLLVHQRLARLTGHISIRFDMSISANVQNFMSPLHQNSSHQQPAMAVRRIFLAAHKGKPIFGHPALKPFDPGHKGGIGGHAAVHGMSFHVVIRLILRPSTQLPAEKQIFDSGCIQSTLKNFTVELRGVFRIGCGPDVHEDFNAVLGEQFRKCLERMRGVPDGVNHAHGEVFAKHTTARIPACPASSRVHLPHPLHLD